MDASAGKQGSGGSTDARGPDERPVVPATGGVGNGGASGGQSGDASTEAGGSIASGGAGGVGGTVGDTGLPDAPHADAGLDPLVGSFQLKYGWDFARLDVRSTPSGYEALVTPVSMPGAAFSLTASSSQADLSGLALLIDGGVQCGYETLKGVRLARAGSGALASPVTLDLVDARNPCLDSCCSCIDDVIGVGQPSIEPDVTAPSVTAAMTSPTAPLGSSFPWDTVKVTLSEGVTRGDLLAALSLVDSSDTPVAATWFASATSAELSWNVVTGARTWPAVWDAISGRSLRVSAAPTMRDPSGNASLAQVLPALSIVDVGPVATGKLDYDAPPTVGLWGDATALASGSAEAAACESGGCVRVGPISSPSSTPRSGIAGRLRSTGFASTLRVRYRFAVSTQGGAAAAASRFGLETARAGTSANRASVQYGPLQDLGAQAGELRWVTAFTDTLIAIPDGAADAEIGFAVSLVFENACAAEKAALVVESVVAE